MAQTQKYISELTELNDALHEELEWIQDDYNQLMETLQTLTYQTEHGKVLMTSRPHDGRMSFREKCTHNHIIYTHTHIYAIKCDSVATLFLKTSPLREETVIFEGQLRMEVVSELAYFVLESLLRFHYNLGYQQKPLAFESHVNAQCGEDDAIILLKQFIAAIHRETEGNTNDEDSSRSSSSNNLHQYHHHHHHYHPHPHPHPHHDHGTDCHSTNEAQRLQITSEQFLTALTVLRTFCSDRTNNMLFIERDAPTMTLSALLEAPDDAMVPRHDIYILMAIIQGDESYDVVVVGPIRL
jgi:hypothetical protein